MNETVPQVKPHGNVATPIEINLGSAEDFEPSFMGVVARALHAYQELKDAAPPSHARHAAILMTKAEELHALTAAWFCGGDGSDPLLSVGGTEQ